MLGSETIKVQMSVISGENMQKKVEKEIRGRDLLKSGSKSNRNGVSVQGKRGQAGTKEKCIGKNQNTDLENRNMERT